MLADYIVVVIRLLKLNFKDIIVMAFDFGETRIGVAIGNTTINIPHPVATIIGKNKYEKLDNIAKLIEKWRPHKFVIGMPSSREDNKSLIASIIKFANRLTHRFNIKHDFVNEDYTSSIAISQLNEQYVYGVSQKNKLDQLAACSILQTYFTFYKNSTKEQ